MVLNGHFRAIAAVKCLSVTPKLMEPQYFFLPKLRWRILCAAMNPIEAIRKNVFAMNQAEFAAEVGVVQSTVHRWDRGTPLSSEHMASIRDAAKRRGYAWSDSWFFEPVAEKPPEVA